jgi:hypothetical protein
MSDKADFEEEMDRFQGHMPTGRGGISTVCDNLRPYWYVYRRVSL